MNNKVSEKESNKQIHKIIEHQNNENLNRLKEMINKSENEIAIEISEKEFNNINNENYEYIISKKILEHIRDKYRNMEVPNKQINRYKAFDHVKLINPKKVKLHIFYNCKNELLFEELLNYIDNTVPFTSMIYLSHNLSEEENLILSRKK